jgi:hypothetical protein
MADISLGELLTLLLSDLATNVERTSPQAAVRLRVTDVDVAIPTYLRLREAGADPTHEPARLMLTLPTTRETPQVGGLSRISITVGIQPLDQAPAPTEHS